MSQFKYSRQSIWDLRQGFINAVDGLETIEPNILLIPVSDLRAFCLVFVHKDDPHPQHTVSSLATDIKMNRSVVFDMRVGLSSVEQPQVLFIPFFLWK